MIILLQKGENLLVIKGKKKVELTPVIMYDLFVYCAKSWIVIVSSRFKRENKLF